MCDRLFGRSVALVATVLSPGVATRFRRVVHRVLRGFIPSSVRQFTLGCTFDWRGRTSRRDRFIKRWRRCAARRAALNRRWRAFPCCGDHFEPKCPTFNVQLLLWGLRGEMEGTGPVGGTVDIDMFATVAPRRDAAKRVFLMFPTGQVAAGRCSKNNGGDRRRGGNHVMAGAMKNNNKPFLASSEGNQCNPPRMSKGNRRRSRYGLVGLEASWRQVVFHSINKFANDDTNVGTSPPMWFRSQGSYLVSRATPTIRRRHSPGLQITTTWYCHVVCRNPIGNFSCTVDARCTQV